MEAAVIPLQKAHRVDKQFWILFHRLPKNVQRQARAKYELLREDQFHPSLHFKRVGKSALEFWSVRVTDDYRAVAVERADRWVWFWIGTHREYERILR